MIAKKKISPVRRHISREAFQCGRCQALLIGAVGIHDPRGCYQAPVLAVEKDMARIRCKEADAVPEIACDGYQRTCPIGTHRGDDVVSGRSSVSKDNECPVR